MPDINNSVIVQDILRRCGQAVRVYPVAAFTAGTHLNFKLSSTTEQIALLDADGAVSLDVTKKKIVTVEFLP